MKVNKVEITACTSLDVAETFGKEHYHVMEDIRNIGSSISTPEFSALFYEDTYKASNGKKNPMYIMNRDGFTLLVMGYTGEKAMKQYGIGKKDNLRDYFAAEELKAVESMECLVSGLVDCGWDYDKIKAFIEQTNTRLIAN